jgi:L-alanine-DL-glutamate epimerase-like enolase superfamily enzyme
VQITNVTVEAYDLGRDFRWAGRRSMDVEAVMLTLEGDEGQLGTSLAWTAELPVRTVVTAIEEAAAPLLAGADPLDRPRILAPLWRAFRVGLPLPVIGIVDVALWDLVARDEDLSIADLLGRRRDRIRGCASAPPVDTPEDCEAMVDELLDAGFRAIKLHVCGDLATDTAVCRAARRAAGDDVDLMMDAMALYDRYAARTLGFVLDDLNFRWFEDPLSDEDLEGWRELRRLLETPIAGADSVRFTARDYGRPAATGAFDIVRMDAARNGITELRALADVAASLGLRCEGHSFGSALGQAANLQVALSISNGDFFELPVPLGGLDTGVQEGLELDEDGFVLAPDGPGLGLELDPDALAACRIDFN